MTTYERRQSMLELLGEGNRRGARRGAAPDRAGLRRAACEDARGVEHGPESLDVVEGSGREKKSIGNDPANQKQFKKQFDLARQQVVDKIESVNLHGVLKDRMVQRVRDLAVQFRMAEREVASCQRRIGIGGEAGAEQLRKMCRTRPDFLAVKRKAGVSEETLLDIKKIYQAAKARIKQLETEI